MPLRDELLAINYRVEQINSAVDSASKLLDSPCVTTELTGEVDNEYPLLASLGHVVAQIAIKTERAQLEEEKSLRLGWSMGMAVLKGYSEQRQEKYGDAKLRDALLAVEDEPERFGAALASVFKRAYNTDEFSMREFTVLHGVVDRDYAALASIGPTIAEKAVAKKRVPIDEEIAVEMGWHLGLLILKECGEREFLPADILGSPED